MLKPLFTIIMLNVSVFITSGCQQGVTPPVDNKNVVPSKVELSAVIHENTDLMAKKAALIRLKGTIAFQSMEGGFFGFIAEDGRKYTPIGLSKEYQQDGLLVEILVTPMPDLMTTSQFGVAIKIREITVLSRPNTPPIDNKHTREAKNR